MKVLRPATCNQIRRGLITLSFLLTFCCSYGQYKNITFQFDRILFHDFADTIERLIPVRFYYSDKWTDTISLSVNSSNSAFEELLNKSLKKYDLSFIITDDDKVILSRGYSIKTNFREEYLRHIEQALLRSDTSDNKHPVAIEEKSLISDEYRLFKIGRQITGKNPESAILSGNVINSADGKFVNGAIAYIEKLKIGVITNDAGYYAITLPPGQYQIEFRMIGMKTARRNVLIYSSGVLDVEMEESTSLLGAVEITGNRSNVKEVSTGIEKINSRMLRQIPMGLGEADVLKSSLLLPGVQTVGEASAGFNVRGGSIDQNLIVLNKTPILNPSHLFGFFSAFNSDLISNVILYKSGMPAKYGGRLSSVMEITPAEGSKEKVNVSGGISPVMARVMVEGPLEKIKGTFILGARATYSDWILKMLKDYRLSKSSANFYDIQGLIRSEIDKKNSITFSGYLSNDKFDYYKEYAVDYRSLAFTLKWAHSFSQKLSAQFYAIMSNYTNKFDTNSDSTLYNTVNYNIDQKILRMEFLYFLTTKHKLEFGTDATFYSLMPGVMEPIGDYSTIIPKKLEQERALEPSLYFSDDYEISPILSVSAGIRGTLFTTFGPGTELQYQDGFTRSVASINDTISYKRGEVMKIYPGLEYRLSSRLIIAPHLSIKMGAQRVYQYIHMISNTTSMSPTDTWKLSDTYFRPERSDQLSFGIYHIIGRNALETSVEAYYKKLNNILDYKGGATLVMNEHLETDVINGTGKAYGIELMMKKPAGSLRDG